MKVEKVVKIEERTARLTILIDPRKKAVFERLCAEEDLTPSQVVPCAQREQRHQYAGNPWQHDGVFDRSDQELRSRSRRWG